MMKYIFTLFVLGFALLASTQAQAQTVEEYFHGAANAFINADMQNALETVDRGLSQYPNNDNLSQLKRLIEEEEKEKQQQQQNQQQSSEQQEEENQDQEEQEQEQTSEQEEQEQKEASKQNEEDANNQPEDIEEGEDLIPNEISKEDADKILKALAQKEKDLLKEFKKPKSKANTTHDKDW